MRDKEFVATIAAIIMSGNHSPDLARISVSVAAARQLIAEVEATQPKGDDNDD